MVWGRGGEWSIVGAPPLPPHSCIVFFFPCFWFKISVWSCRHRTANKGLVGNPSPPPPHPHPFFFFLILKIVCIIQFLIDSSWLLGMCFAVTHQHSTFSKWVCPRNCWVILTLCCADEPVAVCFCLFVQIAIWAFWIWFFIIHISRTCFYYLKCSLLVFFVCLFSTFLQALFYFLLGGG